MRLRPTRGFFTVLATFLVLAISFDSSPTLPVVPKPTGKPAPDPRELALVDELVGRATSQAPRSSTLQAFRPGDLDAALASLSARPSSYNLFEGGHRRGEEEVLRHLPFGRAIAQASERRRIDPLLLAAMVETESGFAPDAVSPQGAIGLMQLVPGTGELYGKQDLFDPYVNLDAGSQYIGALIDRYRGDLPLALAAYNCGPATVTRFGGVPPFSETREFVKGVLARYVEHRENAKRHSQATASLLQPSRGGSGLGRQGRSEGLLGEREPLTSAR